MARVNEAVPADLRAKVNEILDRAQADEQFRHSLEENPEAVLSDAGFEPGAVEELSREIEASSPEVVGHMRSQCNATCDIISCWITICSYLGATS